MHICLTAQEYTADVDMGGIGAYTWHQSAALRQEGHRVTVLSGAHSSKLNPPSAGRSLARRWRRRLPGIGLHGVSRLRYARYVAQRAEAIDRVDPLDIIETPDWGAEGFFLALRRKIPLVVKLHTPQFVVNRYDRRPARLDSIVGEWLEKQVILRADLITSPSASLARIVCQHYGIPSERVHILPYPIDEAVFHPADVVQRKEDAQIVLYVGRLMRRKGVFALAQAIPIVARACPQAIFLFVGSNPGSAYDLNQQREILQQIGVHELQQRVSFLPRQSREQLLSLYHRAAVCVVPSLYDNLPYACLEAMACGKPVVASAVGGLAEIIVSGENGLLAPPDQPQMLAEQLIGLLNDSERRRQLGKNARSYVEEKLAFQPIAQATVAAYATVLRRPDSSAHR